MKENSSNLIDSAEDRINFKLLGKVLLMPFTWYLGLFTLGYYIFRSTITYINPYLTDAFGVSVGFATAFAATVRLGMLMIMSPTGGYIRDRILGGRATPIALIGATGAMIFAIVMSFIPQLAGFSYMVMGVASAIGYSSDIWLYNLCGRWLDHLGNAGYRNIWLITAAGGVMMIVMALQLNRHYKSVRTQAASE